MITVYKMFILALVGACWLPAIACGDQQSPTEARDTELPEALQGLGLRPEQILTAEEAAQIRGTWVMNLNLPFFATQIEGYGPFSLNLWTISGGANAGTPIFIRIVIP